MKKLTLRSFAMGFGKDWIAPKLGAGFAVWILTKALLQQSDQKAAIDALVKIIESASDSRRFQVLIICGGSLIGLLALKFFALAWPKARWIFKYTRGSSYVASFLNFLIGTFTVPLAIVAVSIFAGDVAWYETKGWQLWLLATAIYVICGAALYWMAEDEKNDGRGAAFWFIQLPPSVDGGKVEEVLNEQFKKIEGLGKVVEITNSSDGNALFELPIVYPITKWSNEDLDRFGLLLEGSTQLINKNIAGAKVRGRVNSPEVAQFLKKNKKPGKK